MGLYDPRKFQAERDCFEQSGQVSSSRLIFASGWCCREVLCNPYSFCGSPLFANGQAGLFYPLKTLNFIFTTVISSILLSAAHLFVAAIFTLAYLRELGLRLDVSLFGAVVFAFSRNIIGWLGFPVADAAIMLPGLFWITERL